MNVSSAERPHASTMKIRANTVNSGVFPAHAPGRQNSIRHSDHAWAFGSMREIPEPSRPRKTPKAGLSR